MGRPKKNLTEDQWKSVDYMCFIHCTGEEIAGVLGMDYDTLNRNCKETKKMPISEYIKKHQSGGRMSLRRAQWKSAENGNVTMQIWLGKQWLGQTEKAEAITNTISDNTRGEVAKMIEKVGEYEADKGDGS